MKLFFREYGSGPPVIILHGLYGSSDNWVTIAKKLENSYNVFIPDQRNHGNSPHSVQHNYQNMCSDLEEFVTAHGLEKFVLIGHSMGGKTAMTYALKNPKTLSALVVVDISPFTRYPDDARIASFHEKVLLTLLNNDIISPAGREETEKNLLSVINEAKTTRFLMKNLYRAGDGHLSWKLNAAALYNNLEKLMTGITLPEESSKKAIGFPVLFIRGGESDYLPESHFQYIKRLFPVAEIITIEGTGHWLHAENPDRFVEIVGEFLSGGY